ncbi:MAG TPA: Hpt domain-containing protein [Candidatus Sumerlaeota bacterium]|nr:Hpt domain-containing protein [Candidatus Sumerlaeota bacterium]
MNMNPDHPSGQPPPVDMRRLAEITDGDITFEREMLDLFLSEFTKRIDRIAGSISEGNSEIIRREAHTLAGSSANMGADYLGDLARDIEHAAREGALERCAPLFEPLRVEAERVRAFLESRLNEIS